MPIRLILAPYDSGHREWRMGAGPTHLLRHGLASRVRALGHAVGAEVAEVADRPGLEIGTTFALWREVARRVRCARERGELPVVLSGNCGATIAAVAAAGGETGVVWLDAHGDFNTPETSRSGFLDGMALATLVGRCWRSAAATIPGFEPVPERLVVHVGARDLDPEEAAQLESSAVAVVTAAELRAAGVAGALTAPVDALAGCKRVHVHIDLDVLDAQSVGRANGFAPDGGMRMAEVADVIRMIALRAPIAGVTFSAYDPEHDSRGAVFHAACALLELVAELQNHRAPDE